MELVSLDVYINKRPAILSILFNDMLDHRNGNVRSKFMPRPREHHSLLPVYIFASGLINGYIYTEKRYSQ